MANDGYFEFSQYEFMFCPNCLKPLMRLQYELEQKLKMIKELEGIEKNLKDKNWALKRLKVTIRELSQITTDKQALIRAISKRFTKILEAFEYPKLRNSYIDEKSYLPYVRGNKYNDIGSLADEES